MTVAVIALGSILCAALYLQARDAVAHERAEVARHRQLMREISRHRGEQ